jgi:gas vesicle protein
MEDPNMNEKQQGQGIADGIGPSVAIGFVLGALVGAGIALLLAPATGKETRRRVADVGRKWSGAARDKFDQARDIAEDLKQDAQSALDAGREAFEKSRKSDQAHATSVIEPNS